MTRTAEEVALEILRIGINNQSIDWAEEVAGATEIIARDRRERDALVLHIVKQALREDWLIQAEREAAQRWLAEAEPVIPPAVAESGKEGG